MRTRFYISENNDFIKEFMDSETFPFPEGINSLSQLKKIVTSSPNSVLHDFYFFVDDGIVPLQLGDKVILGGLHWRVIDRVFNYNKNILDYTLKQDL